METTVQRGVATAWIATRAIEYLASVKMGVPLDG